MKMKWRFLTTIQLELNDISSSQYNRGEVIKRSLVSSDIQENILERMFAIFVFLTRVNVFPNGLHAYNDFKR